MLLLYLQMVDTEEDKCKLEMLYEKYHKLMFYIANQILCDQSLAEDAVHDTFIKIIENLDKIEDVNCHKSKSLICIMVRNHSINLYNERKRHTYVPLEDYEHLAFNDFIGEIEYAFDESNILEKAVMNLSVIYRDIITLKYVQDLSNLEIATLLNISEATVRKRIERSKKKIQDFIEKGDDSNAL